MSVNLEVKGTLAKLLATEDLIVEHRSVSTASFNVQSRVLTLPRWERASSNVVDMLIAHEVGHALFTPNEDWRKKTSVPMGFINVTEDVRIETLMKQKYSGLPKTFYKGYSELYNQDFFSLEGEDVNSMNVADRVNLYFKVGGFLRLEFSDAEMVVIKQCSAARTFDEAIAAAEALYALHEQQKNEQEQSEEEVSADVDSSQEPSEGEQGEGEDQQPGEANQEPPEQTTGQGETESESEQSGDSIESMEDIGGSGGGKLSDEVKTMDSLNEAIEDMTNASSFGEPEYISYPKTDPSRYIVDNAEIHNYIQDSWAKQVKYFEELDDSRSGGFIHSSFGIHRDRYNKFKKDIQSEVNYMVKEFECKKSASAYSRAATSRTGVLDCTKLHTYKYNEDLFKKVTTLPEGKNHGLLFVLDWSGSMCDILEDTIKQLISLVMFCDKVGIPFDVYAFTNEWYGRSERRVDEDAQEGTFYIGTEFGMMNVLTSKVNRKELHRQLETMYMIASSYTNRSYDIVPSRVGLSGTPLNEALVVMRDILPKFKSNNNVEKAHVMVLTDGEAACCRVSKVTTDWTGESVTRPHRILGTTNYLRNRVTGTVRSIGAGATSNLTTTLISDLRTQFPESTFTGFRVLESRGGWFIRQATGYDDAIQAKWRKERSIALTNFGYHKYYIVSTGVLQESSEFSVAEDSSKAKIKSAFAKSLKSKKSNKKILGDFIGLIA